MRPLPQGPVADGVGFSENAAPNGPLAGRSMPKMTQLRCQGAGGDQWWLWAGPGESAVVEWSTGKSRAARVRLGPKPEGSLRSPFAETRGPTLATKALIHRVCRRRYLTLPRTYVIRTGLATRYWVYVLQNAGRKGRGGTAPPRRCHPMWRD